MLELRPDTPEALSNLGSTLTRAGRADEALNLLRQASTLRPNDAELKFNLGNALIAAERFNEAADVLADAIRLCPSHSRAHANLGVALKETGDLDGAIASFREALAADPRNKNARWNLALALLMNGSYAAGWQAYEAREALPDFPIRRIADRRWDGAAVHDGPLLVHAEQGLGDTIQFARYIPLAAERAGAVVFAIPHALDGLIRAALPQIPLVPIDRCLPPYGAQAPLMSLPHRLGLPEPYWPGSGPYLRASPTLIHRWRTRLPAEGLNVGIAWQGRPDYRADSRRSIPLHHFSPLALNKAINLVSLQKGQGREQSALVPWGKRLIDFGAELDADGAFLDSAAVIASLDLVITSDTAIAHLAAALGAETWLALARVPDWRWGASGERTPWYPTMRLFRQSRHGDWSDVFARIAAEAGALATGLRDAS